MRLSLVQMTVRYKYLDIGLICLIFILDTSIVFTYLLTYLDRQLRLYNAAQTVKNNKIKRQTESLAEVLLSVCASKCSNEDK